MRETIYSVESIGTIFTEGVSVGIVILLADRVWVWRRPLIRLRLDVEVQIDDDGLLAVEVRRENLMFALSEGSEQMWKRPR